MDMIRLDMRGKQCPIPVIETKKAFARIVGEGCVETRVDNQTAVENLKRLASSLGGSAEVTMSGDCDYLVRITASVKVCQPMARCEAGSPLRTVR